jgi:hypothetical protein
LLLPFSSSYLTSAWLVEARYGPMENHNWQVQKSPEQVEQNCGLMAALI